MGDHADNEPQELRERRALTVRHEAGSALGPCGRAFVAALQGVEIAAVELIAKEASFNLIDRDATRRAAYATDVRRLMAEATLGRLGPLLRPYLGEGDPEALASSEDVLRHLAAASEGLGE